MNESVTKSKFSRIGLRVLATAATRIQCAWRMRRSCRRLAVLKNKLEYGKRVLQLQEDAAATKIQQCVRSHFARRQLRILQKRDAEIALAAVRLQKVYRSFAARLLLHQHSAATLIQWHFLKWRISKKRDNDEVQGTWFAFCIR